MRESEYEAHDIEQRNPIPTPTAEEMVSEIQTLRSRVTELKAQLFERAWHGFTDDDPLPPQHTLLLYWAPDNCYGFAHYCDGAWNAPGVGPVEPALWMHMPWVPDKFRVA